MKIQNLGKLLRPQSRNVDKLYQRSNVVAQYHSPFDYIREPTHCCTVLVCQWWEITTNYYKNSHARRHILMQSHLLEVQGFQMRCSPFFELPAFDDFASNQTVYLHLRAAEHNDSFIIEIVSITNDQGKAMPLYGIYQSMDELFKPTSSDQGTKIPCCGIVQCKKRDVKVGKDLMEMMDDGGRSFTIKLHSLFDLSSEVDIADSSNRICFHVKINQQEIKALSGFVCPVGFCSTSRGCHCEACKHMAAGYHFGKKMSSTELIIPKHSDLYFISQGLSLTCESKNAVFLVTCKRCMQHQYVGQTIGTNVRDRIKGLCYEFKNEKKSRLCNHFRQKDHDGISDWEIMIVDQLAHPNHKENLNDLEQLWIDRLETLNKQQGGLNMNPASGQRTLLFISDSKLINYSNALRSHEIVSKRFPGKSIDEISKMAPTIIEREKPKRVILHVGSQDVSSDKPPKLIAKDILSLTNRMKSATGYMFWISGLLPRDGLKNNKVVVINKYLKHYCQENNLRFVDHSTIDPSIHFKVDRHLNAQGIHEFASNIEQVFHEKHSDERRRRVVDLYSTVENIED